MIVLPAHRRLDDVMERLQTGSDRHVDPAPDGGFDVAEDDMQAGRSCRQSGRFADPVTRQEFVQRLAGQSSAALAMKSAIYAYRSTPSALQVKTV